MSAVISAIVAGAQLAGVRLSPFWAGAALAGLIALVVGGGAAAAGLHLYNAGYAAADGAWREKALEAQLAAARADIDAAKKAAGDEASRAATIQQQADEERAGTDAYVEDLKKRITGACALSCDDLRGMRIKSSACAAPAGAAAAGGAPVRSRWRALGKPQ
ncbi:protease IV [Bradyrhizobium jicamae]|uniref:protease IV n=1 Tax=Bradyrhizobium jicamae TaxID=280332 RepID=UPI001BAAE90C|nr:protease IV [Bradyrhizobium jicamae]MBR0755629.1 protease IV [Bradyrhizobium jicamae]